MNTRVQTARDFGDLPGDDATDIRDRALAPAAGIALAVLGGSLCWIAIFTFVL